MSRQYSLIRNGLYLGDMSCALDSALSLELDIRNVLSLTDRAAAEQVRTVQTEVCSEIKFKLVELEDSQNADLLSHLDECCEFVATGLANSRGSVLVHCFAGVSRSASVVIAFLMKSESLSLQDALDRVRKQSSCISPNIGFMKQLSLYGEMGNRVDESSMQFRQYKLEKLAASIQGGEQEIPAAALVSDPLLQSHKSKDTVLHKCRKCRRVLFTEDAVLRHEPGKGSEAFGWRTKARESIRVTAGENLSTVCSSYFTEPVEWMREGLKGVIEGKLLCPKCNSRVGAFNWAGIQCSCGRWITPAFQFHKNRVDDSKYIPVSPLLKTT